MATYTAQMQLASGLLYMVFFNDNGDATDYNLTDNYVMEIGNLSEAVEENGLGGVMRIPRMDITLFDREAKFHDEIFSRTNVSQVQCLVYMANPLALLTRNVIFGSVKLSTVEYETLYDDGVTVSRKCSFTILGLLDKLTSVDPIAIRTYLDTVEVSGSATSDVVFPLGGFSKPNTFSNDATVGTENWATPYYAGYPDGAAASVGLNAFAGTKTSKYLKLLFFTHSLGYPLFDTDYSAYTVDGIEVLVKRVGPGGKVTDANVKLVKGGVIGGTDLAGTAGSSPWASTSEIVTYGGPTELWGRSWVGTDFNDSDFGVAFAAKVTSPDVDTAYVDSVSVKIYMSNPSGAGTWVKVLDVFDSAATVMADYFTIDPTTHDIGDVYRGNYSSPTDVSFDDIYIPYRRNDGSYYGLFADPASTSFLGMQDLKEVVKSLASAFLVYVDVNFDLTNNHVSFVLKRRNTGTAWDSADVGLLESSVESSFIGYDAVRTYPLGAVPVIDFLGQVATPAQNPISMNSSAFQKIAQKFDFASPVLISISPPFLLDSGTFYAITAVTIDSVKFTDYMKLLNTKFLEYWESPVLITRKYGGSVGIMPTAAIPIPILSKVTIDSIDYTVIEAERDVIENEMTLKLVQFS